MYSIGTRDGLRINREIRGGTTSSKYNYMLKVFETATDYEFIIEMLDWSAIQLKSSILNSSSGDAQDVKITAYNSS